MIALFATISGDSTHFINSQAASALGLEVGIAHPHAPFKLPFPGTGAKAIFPTTLD
jgi:hypothetical protein